LRKQLNSFFRDIGITSEHPWIKQARIFHVWNHRHGTHVEPEEITVVLDLLLCRFEPVSRAEILITTGKRGEHQRFTGRNPGGTCLCAWGSEVVQKGYIVGENPDNTPIIGFDLTTRLKSGILIFLERSRNLNIAAKSNESKTEIVCVRLQDGIILDASENSTVTKQTILTMKTAILLRRSR